MDLDTYLALDERNAKLAPRKKDLIATVKREKGWTLYEDLMRMAWCLAALGRFDEARACVEPVLAAEGIDDEGNDVSGFAFEAAALCAWIAEPRGDAEEWAERAAGHAGDWVYPIEEIDEHLEYVKKESINWALYRAASVLRELAVQRLRGSPEPIEAFEAMLEQLRARL